MSLFKNKWLAMMLLCGSMDLTYVDAMRRHPERKVDAAASCKVVDEYGLDGTDYAVGKPTVLVGDTRETTKSLPVAAVPLIHTYHHQFMQVFAAKFPNGVFFDSVCSELAKEGIQAVNPECAFLAVLDPGRSYAGAHLLFRPQYMFIGDYKDSSFEVHSNIQAFMIENDARVRLQAVNDIATLHPEPNVPRQGNPMRVSPESLALVFTNGEPVLHDTNKTRTVIYHMILNNHPVIGMVILLGENDAIAWNSIIRQDGNWGGMMNRLRDFGWLSSSPSLFEPGAPLAAFLPQPTMVAVLPEPEQPVASLACLREAKLEPCDMCMTLRGAVFALPKMPFVTGSREEIAAGNIVSVRIKAPEFTERFSEVMRCTVDHRDFIELTVMPALGANVNFPIIDQVDRLGRCCLSASMLIGNNDIRVRHNGCDIDPSILGDSTGYLCYSMAFHTGESDDPVFQHGVIVLLNRMDAAVWRRAIAQPEVTLRAVFQQCIGEDALTDILRAFNTSGILSPLFSWDD